jgi:hypothetical protein
VACGWRFLCVFLDYREQALLVIPLFTDIVEHAGGTVICSDAIPAIAKHLVSIFCSSELCVWMLIFLTSMITPKAFRHV